ncbi:MAG: DinB family protein [Microscillaceae bacterium]|jgi:uncharacterized damage-inducible protein DinB|nr:DinB family protein [Microscillaceae bacterium]
MQKDLIDFLPEFYQGYVNHVEEENFLTAMQNQIAITTQLLAPLSDEQGNFRYAPEKWSIKEVLNHIIDTERIMSYRALRFARQDTVALPGFDENLFAPNAQADRRTMHDLLAELQIVRQSSIALAQSMTTEMLQQSGIASEKRISVLGLLYIIPGHEIHHRKVLQTRYLNHF